MFLLGIQPDTKRSASKSDRSDETLTVDTAQEDMVERVHTGKEKTDGTSNPLADIHPSDTAESHRNSKEARDSQSGNQTTFIRCYSYSNEDQKGHVVNEQPNVKRSHDEPGLKAEFNTDKAKEIHRESRRGSLESYICPEEVSRNETGLLEETYQTRIHEWCSSTIHNTENYHQNASDKNITVSQLGMKESDRRTILEEDIYHDKDVTITLEEDDDEYEEYNSPGLRPKAC